MEKKIRILTVENSSADLKLILGQLDKDGISYSNLNVQTKEDFIKGITNYEPDIILTDYSLPGMDYLIEIDLIKKLSPFTPVIIVTSSNNESIAVECMKKGAEDYILKNNIIRLGFAVKGALENKRLKKEKEVDEKKILKLNRTYAVIGQINEMIVRVRDRDKLYEEACRITVETGKYRLVWIGLVDEKNKIIRPHVWNGFDGGFLKEISLMSVDYILHNDPIQNIILSGKHFICNNILEEDSGYILRKNGLAHGFHSLIALPLIVQNKVIGSFNIYADEINFFTEEELKLLIEIAGDLSFSIETIINQKAITVSEVRYRRLFESAKEGIIILNAETGEIVDINPFMLNNFGYRKDELIGKQLYEIDILKDSFFNRDSFLELLQRESIRYEDIPLKKKDGTYLAAEFIANVFWIDNVKVLQCNIHDITQRKRTEESLRFSEARLHALLQTIPDMIWLKDPDGVYLSCNKTCEKFLGAKEADIVGKTDYDFVDKELADYFRENDARTIKAGEPTKNEEYITFADDGHSAFMDTIKSPLYDTKGKLIGVLGISRDITERKRTEKDIQDREKRFRAIFDQAPIGIALLDMQGFPIISNLPLSRMVGYSVEELSKMKFTDFTHPDDADKDMSQYKDLVNGIISQYSMEKRYIHKNGNIVWANLIVTSIRNEDGKAHEIIGMAEDVTERKHAEVKLRESEELFRHSFDYAANGICIIGLDNKFMRVNNAFSEIIGYNNEELKQFTFSDITYPEDLSIGMEYLKNMLDGEFDKSSFEKRYIRKDHNIIWVLISTSLVRDANHIPQFFITQIIDISERKNMQEDLLKLSRAVEQSPASIIITDTKGNIEYINPKVTQITGYQFAEVLGQNPRIFRSGEKPKNEYEVLWKTISSGHEWQGEMHNKKKNGDLYWELVSISPVMNEKGIIAHYLAVKEDITELKHVEKELIKAKEKAESANRLKDAFIANISHEIRTPVNGILGMTGLVRETFRDLIKKEDEELFEGINLSSQRLIRTVDLILNYSRLQVGEYALYRKKIELSSVCSNLIKEFAIEAKSKLLELTLQIDCSNSTVFADEYSTIMAVSNLISNAIKFTKQGFINLFLHNNYDNDLILDVNDSGIGIGEEFLDRIFEPYRQEHVGYSRSYEGVGLGLALVKRVLELNSAKISVKSKKGEGTTFSINFGKAVKPVEKINEPGRITGVQLPKEIPAKKVVLIVEDDLINQLTIKRFLNNNYSTLIAESFDTASEILKKNKVDIILMDISIIGEKNGLELARELKASKLYSQIPIIAVTAHAFETDRQNALDSGCNNFLSKPFSKEEILNMIATYLHS